MAVSGVRLYSWCEFQLMDRAEEEEEEEEGVFHLEA